MSFHEMVVILIAFFVSKDNSTTNRHRWDSSEKRSFDWLEFFRVYDVKKLMMEENFERQETRTNCKFSRDEQVSKVFSSIRICEL